MRFALFYHSFVSCWNHGNAHFLRGFARELIRLGHQVAVYEPEDGWSRTNALLDGGAAALECVTELIPGVQLQSYSQNFDPGAAVAAADVVIVHEWNPPELIAAIGKERVSGGRFTLLFHDTHHRAVTAPHELSRFDLDGYDGVLVFGEVLREIYGRLGWGRRVYTWHEAADVELFRPRPEVAKDLDLIWIGNWGDEERSDELRRFLLDPVRDLGLKTSIRGVRYPGNVRRELISRGIDYGGWLPNHLVPAEFARARVTVHVPRRPYVEALPGIPTIRVFEALACGIPLICSPWRDVEGLFPPGSFVIVQNETEMVSALSLLVRDRAFAHELAEAGLRAIHHRHTCAHRVQELLSILNVLREGMPTSSMRQSNSELAAP